MKTDLSYLETMTEGDKDLIKELIGIFSTQVVEYCDQLDKFYEEENWTELSKLAHKAKSTLAIMGMKELSEKLKQLELMSKEGKDRESYASVIKFFNSECKEAVLELQHYR